MDHDALPSPASGEELPNPEAATARISEYRRKAYIPIVEPGDGSPSVSKFSGAPLLAPGEAWPACGNCGQPMQLFLQLAGESLPPEAREWVVPGQILQFFYCTNSEAECDDACEAYLPHAESTLLRLIEVAAGAADGPPVPADMFPPLRITGWTAADDYPNSEEVEELDALFTEDELDEVRGTFPRSGEKLLGWPHWVQGVEYPDCRVCGRRMALLFQFDSEQNVPWMWGDSGVGHITQCSEHRAELAFGWACY